MATCDTTKIIDNVIEAEGGDKVTNLPEDRGGRTQFGISERSHPEAWADGKVTEEEAREIFYNKYVKAPGFEAVSNIQLLHQLVDFGVNSGTTVAIQKLQEILGVEPDGIIGPITRAALKASNQVVVNNKLVNSRVRMLGRIVNRRRNQAEFIEGWLNRATEFTIYENE